jgi:hypothetical protein
MADAKGSGKAAEVSDESESDKESPFLSNSEVVEDFFSDSDQSSEQEDVCYICNCASYPGGRISINGDTKRGINMMKKQEIWCARSDIVLDWFSCPEQEEAGRDYTDGFDVSTHGEFSDPPHDVLLICDGCDKCCHLICAGTVSIIIYNLLFRVAIIKVV